MIITEKTEVKINLKNINHYSLKGYKCELTDIIDVDSIDVTKGSHKKVIVKCELCGNERELFISKYWLNYNRQGFYSCNNCSNDKRVKTMNEKYGVDYISQTKENRERLSKYMSSDYFKEKSKKTLLKKYGVDHYSKTDEFKEHIKEVFSNEELIKQSNEKRENTCLEKYGVSSYMLTNEYLEKRSITMNDRYGATHSIQSDIIREKIKKSFQENWGVNSPFESDDIRQISKESILKKYGVDNVFMSDDIKEKIKKTNLEKYGVDNPMINEKIKDKVRITKEKLGLQSKNISKFKKYRHRISYLTKRNKKELYENWNGHDYYDNEYIKENFKLNHLDKKYPTIDHKTSVLYGFLNGISEEEISDMGNLCITKRSINSIKGFKNENVFLN